MRIREEARRFLRSFITRFPQELRASEAQLTVARTVTLESKHTQAAAEYQKVLETYPKAPEVPEAMWQLGQSFIELKFCGDAKAIFTDLAKRYPRSQHAGEVKARIKDLQKMARDPKVCTS